MKDIKEIKKLIISTTRTKDKIEAEREEKTALEVLRKKEFIDKNCSDFMKALTKLSKKHGVYVGGCGCCGSPYLYNNDGACFARNLEYAKNRYSEEERLETIRVATRGQTPQQIEQQLKLEDYNEEPFCAASRGRNVENTSDRTKGTPTAQRLESNTQGTINTLTTVAKDNYVVEPQMLTPKRTEYGKQMRKAYESGEHEESRHTMTEYEVRNDGIANCHSTVTKDCLVAEEQTILAPINFKHKAGDGMVTRERKETNIVPSLQAQEGHNQRPYVKEPIMSQRPHGYNKGSYGEVDAVPPLTSNGYQENNHLHEEIVARTGFGKYTKVDIAPCQTTKSPMNELNSSAVLKFEEQPKTRIRGLKDGFSTARNDAKGSTVQGSKVTYDTAETIDTITRSFQGMVSEKAMDAPIEVKDGTMYNPYNRAEIVDIAPTQTANCGSATSSATIAKFEEVDGRTEAEGWDTPDESDEEDTDATVKKDGYYEKNGKLYKVRKLTPKESFRLMGWKDERIDLILNAKDEKGKRLISDSACYFLCGNSIIIQHLMGIFGQLFRVKWKKKVFGTHENPNETEQLNLFDLIKPEEAFYENWPEFDSIKD